MKEVSDYSIQRVVDKLITNLIFSTYLIDRRPGIIIQKLRKEDREILQHATSKHFNHRVEGIT